MVPDTCTRSTRSSVFNCGAARLRLDQTDLPAAANGRGSAIDPKFDVQDPLVRLHRVQRNVEPFPDLTARQAGVDQTQDLEFSGSERLADLQRRSGGTGRGAVGAGYLIYLNSGDGGVA